MNRKVTYMDEVVVYFKTYWNLLGGNETHEKSVTQNNLPPAYTGTRNTLKKIMISNQQNAIAAECPSGTPTTSFEVRV
jgi:hypothetical protein